MFEDSTDVKVINECEEYDDIIMNTWSCGILTNKESIN